MPSCFVPLCKSGYSSTRRKNKEQNIPEPHFFRPKTIEQLNEWEKVIQREDRALCMTDSVCSIHFHCDFIIDHFSIKLPDGGVVEYKREKAVLKEGAIPSVFPKYSKYLQKSKIVTRKTNSRNKSLSILDNISEVGAIPSSETCST